MKKTISVILILSMLMSVLCAFPFVSASDTPYSGGSGTEDDPYLISTEKDIKELCENIKNDPSLYMKKPHFKLINDISISSPGSPIFTDKLAGIHCYLEMEHSVSKLVYTLYPWNDDIMDDSSVHNDEIKKLYEKNYLDIMGPVFFRTEYYNRDVLDYTRAEYTGGETNGLSVLFDAHDRLTSSPILDRYTKNIYRAVAFTGVFDGNGHTVIAENTYLFGFLKNGAVVKNLTLKGNHASFAYEVDGTCLISNCNFDASGVYSFECNQFNVGFEDGSDIPKLMEYISQHQNVIVKNSGVIERFAVLSDNLPSVFQINNGTIKDYMYYGTLSSPSSLGNAPVNCIDFSSPSSMDSENVYTKDECLASGGSPSAFEGFDFENVWIMKEGLPYLRSALKCDSGDINVDGVTNAVDINLLKRHLCGIILPAEFHHTAGADMDKNGEINAVDSALLKRMIAG